MTRRRLLGAAVALLAALGVVQWWSGGPPLALLVASYLAVLDPLAERLPLRVAVSAALVVPHAVWLAALLALPLVRLGPLRPGVALLVLLLPCLTLLRPDPRSGESRPEDATERTPERWPVLALVAAGTGGTLVVSVVLWAARADPYSLAAWAASGDARLHLVFARMVLDQGGLHGTTFTMQPQYHEALTALLLDTHGRGALGPAASLAHDLRGQGEVSLALVVTWSLSCVAVLHGLGVLRRRTGWVVAAAASLLAATGLGLGVVTRDGFLPVLLLVPLLLATLTVLAWLHTADRSDAGITAAVAVVAVALPLVAFTWTPMAVVTGIAAMPAVWRVRTRERVAVVSAGALAAAAYTVVVLHHSHRFVHVDGSMAKPALWLVGAVPLLALLAVRRTGAFTPMLVGTVVSGGIAAYAAFAQSGGPAWVYFPAKVSWIWLLVGLPLLLVPLARVGSRALAALGAAAVLAAVVVVSPISSPIVPPRISAWDQPDTTSLRLTVHLGRPGTRYVVYRVSPADDRLTNFWLAAHDRHVRPYFEDAFIRWAYLETGTAQDVCDLLEAQPGRVVATADPAAQQELGTACGHQVRVRLLPVP